MNLCLLCVGVCTQVVKSMFDGGDGGAVRFHFFLRVSGTCYNVTAPETCMQAANIKGFTGRTAVQCIERKHKSPGLSPLGVSEEVFVNKLMSGGTSIKKISEIQV